MMAERWVVSITILQMLYLSCPGAVSFMDMDELKSVYYGLDILSEPVIMTQDTPFGAVHVTSKFGQQYQCTFPDHSIDEKKKEEEEKMAAQTGIVEMLKPMEHNACLFKSKDWWSYEFCYGKYIRQFHMEDGDIKGNIIYLGYYHKDFDWNNETVREDRLRGKSVLNRYHSQYYTLGTKCDITDQTRRAEVRFMCEENSEDYLARVDESETCVYTVTVMTSRICRHPYLKAPAKRKSVPISCNPVLSEDQFEEYIQEKEEKGKKEDALKLLTEKENFSRQDWEHELSKVLESEMSTTAKELLIKQFFQKFSQDGHTPMSREDFQKKYGKDETVWQTYVKGTELNSKQNKEHQEKKDSSAQTEQEGETGRNEETELDEDDEILSDFDKEISTIREKFQNSQNKLTSIKKKLILDRPWESEIENAIREAEEELGVKVDRSLISGLSNTLDKLVNKLHDTERELSSMDKEIGKVKPGKNVQKNKDEEGQAGADNQDVPPSERKKDEEEEDRTVTVSVEDTDIDSEEDVSRVGAASTAEAPADTQDHEGSLHDRILAPPKLGDDAQGTRSSHIMRTIDKDKEEEDKSEDTGDKSEDHAGMEENESRTEIEVKTEENDDVDLPKDLQKLLEDSVRRELQKHKQQSDSQPLGFDSDHSFSRDKSVHIFQQEDEDGKTNRFIVVFGFNTFNDESAEKERQSVLEDNYSFVYKGKKQRK